MGHGISTFSMIPLIDSTPDSRLLLQEYFFKKKSIFVAHDQTQHSSTHIFNTGIKTKVSLQVIC
jgi:hypothetical protein